MWTLHLTNARPGFYTHDVYMISCNFSLTSLVYYHLTLSCVISCFISSTCWNNAFWDRISDDRCATLRANVTTCDSKRWKRLLICLEEEKVGRAIISRSFHEDYTFVQHSDCLTYLYSFDRCLCEWLCRILTPRLLPMLLVDDILRLDPGAPYSEDLSTPIIRSTSPYILSSPSICRRIVSSSLCDVTSLV